MTIGIDFDHKGRTVKRQLKFPVSNLGWCKHYVARFNKAQHQDAAHLAMFCLMLALRDEEAE